MIYDQLCNWRRYIPRHKVSEFCQAIEFLRTFTPDTELGKHVLVEGLIYANVQEYVPKAASEAVIEYHEDFVDLQTLLAGTEDIFYSPIEGLEKNKDYDAEADYGLYKYEAAQSTSFKMEPGNFVIFFTGEGHAPCIANCDNPTPVRKVVLKMHRSLFE